jgi:hypothetical protein
MTQSHKLKMFLEASLVVAAADTRHTVYHNILSNFLHMFCCSPFTLLAFVYLEMYTGCFLVTSPGLCRQATPQ